MEKSDLLSGCEFFRSGDMFYDTGKASPGFSAEEYVITSKIILYRNLKDECFPICACDKDLCRIRDEVFAGVKQIQRSLRMTFHTAHPDELSAADREFLVERFLQEEVLLDPRHGSGVCVSRDLRSLIGINGNNHLMLQTFSVGNCFKDHFRRIHKLDDYLSRKLPFAFSPEYGYLTASPAWAGTGMVFSSLLHLPGLVMGGQMEKVIQALEALHFSCSRIYPEDLPDGSLFRLTNRCTLGMTEEELLEKTESVIRRLVSHERKARRILLGTRRDHLLHRISSAYGLLRHGYRLNTPEVFEALGMLLLGLDLKLFNSFTAGTVTDLMFRIQDGHLQKYYGKKMSDEEKLSARASLLRSTFSGKE